MTHFEVLERDGPARRGELSIDGATATTPCVATHRDDHVRVGEVQITDSGTVFHPRSGDVAPDAPAPIHVYEEVSEPLARIATESAEGHVAAVAHGGREPGLRRDAKEALTDHRLLVVGGASALHGSPRELVEVVAALRAAGRPDTALYAPGAARPWTAPLLIYAGVDVLDDSAARIAAARSTYFTPSGEVPAEDLEEPVCPCPDCRDTVPTDFDPLLRHNRAALETAVAETRRAVSRGRTRELVERTSRSAPWLVETLRRLDEERDYLRRTTPAFRTSELTALGEESLRRVEIKSFADRMHRRYEPPEADAAVLLPCSAGKPYSTSHSHGQFRGAVRGRAREIVLTSPMGAVPRELEVTYPAAHYDIPVTGDWSGEEVDWMATNLEKLLADRDYDGVVAHVAEGGYTRAVERVDRELGLDVTYTARNHHPRSDEALDRLDSALEGHRADTDRYRDAARAMTDYILGPGTGDRLLDGATVRGRYPSITVERGGDVLATAVPEYGSLAYTLDAAHLFPDDYRVEIDAFVPMGSVLAPGVLDAPDPVRPGDEVLVEGPEARCVGRAEMSGPEMTRSERGVAVTVRHREEK